MPVLTHKDLEIHGCALSTVATDAQVLKRQAISIQTHCWLFICCIHPISDRNTTFTMKINSHFENKYPGVKGRMPFGQNICFILCKFYLHFSGWWLKKCLTFIQAGKLKFFGTRPNWAVSYIAYTKFHLPRPVLHLPSYIFTRIGEQVSTSFPAWHKPIPLKIWNRIILSKITVQCVHQIK